MPPAIEKLLILQDRDRKLTQLRAEIASVGPQRDAIQRRAASAQSNLESTRQRGRHIESERKRLELEVDSRKQQIEKYSLQQFQTKKNEEYRALAHEIELAKKEIAKLEDGQIALMEQAETCHQEGQVIAHAAKETGTVAEQQVADLTAREANLRKEFDLLSVDRDQLAAAVEETVLLRYERLRKGKGDRVVVGIEHSACGGCHMRLPAQIIVSCQSDAEIVSCPNCARLLYFTREMVLEPAE